MAIEKFIIDKSDLAALLKGEELAIQPRKNIRGFCVEIAGNVTNGDMVKAMFGEPAIEGKKGILYKFKYRNGKTMFSTYFDIEWWNACYNTRNGDEQ